MTEAAKELFIADRVRAMATVVTEARQGTGLDYHVFVAREGKPVRLAFGVLLRGVSAPVTAEHAHEVLGPTVGQFQGTRKFTYPVCLFFFTLRDEQAYFSWLAEPHVTDAGPKLFHHDKANCVPLTDELLDGIVGQVVSWYDAVKPC